MFSNSRTHLVQIIYDPDGNHESIPQVVRPGHLYVNSGDNVIFTSDQVDSLFFIPNAQELFGVEKDSLVLFIPAGSESVEFTVQPELPCGKEYPYAVYCKDCNDFAEGGSPPRMILK